MNWWVIGWYAWGLAFATFETAALVANARTQTHNRRTLSEQFWAWFKITPGKPSYTAAWLRFSGWATAFVLIWLIPHLLFGLGT